MSEEEKEKETTFKKRLQKVVGKSFRDALTFSPFILLMGLFFMGALGYYYNIPSESFIPNATASIERAANITLTTFYNSGYNKPKAFTFVFFLSIFMAFIYPILRIIIFLVREGLNKNDNKKM